MFCEVKKQQHSVSKQSFEDIDSRSKDLEWVRSETLSQKSVFSFHLYITTMFIEMFGSLLMEQNLIVTETD